jgi:dihydrodipicolinate reductase
MAAMSNLSVCVAGATGWTGAAIAEAVAAAGDLELRSAVSRSAAGSERFGAPVYASAGEALDRVDVLVDFTSHDVAKANALEAIGRGTAVVIGTSGLTAADFDEIGAAARERTLADTHGAVEARGADIAGTQVHSLRLPSFTVSTEVVFGLPDERLSIRHDAGSSATPYVAGTLLAARAAPGRVGLTRGLDTLLLGG